MTNPPPAIDVLIAILCAGAAVLIIIGLVGYEGTISIWRKRK